MADDPSAADAPRTGPTWGDDIGAPDDPGVLR